MEYIISDEEVKHYAITYSRIKSKLIKVTKTSPADIRFFSLIDKNIVTHKTLGNCWIWKGTTRNGYGYFGIKRTNVKSHRFSYELFYGKISSSICVLHRCDTPLCCNPTHLFIGTRAENSLDMKSKSRQSKGEHRPLSKLTEDSVRTIRELYIPKHVTRGIEPLAKRFGVAQCTIYKIVHRYRWRHVK